jgi:ubiquinone biosynthesis protein UbiJ
MVAGEVSTLLNTVTPAVQPLLTFALSAAGSITGDAALVSEIQGVAGQITSSLDTLLSPVTGLLQTLGLASLGL